MTDIVDLLDSRQPSNPSLSLASAAEKVRSSSGLSSRVSSLVHRAKHPTLLGALLGVAYALAPDHISTLVTLTAGLRSTHKAFVVGLSWGLGHATGMVLLCILLHALSGHFNLELMEHYGHYVSGLVLMGLGLYFLATEESHIEKHADGREFVTACDCCMPTAALAEHPSITHATASVEQAFCAPYARTSCRAGRASRSSRSRLHKAAHAAAGVPESAVSTSALQHSANAQSHSDMHGRSIKGILLGMVQAFLCPCCIAGVVPAGQVATDVGDRMKLAVFLSSFAMVSTLGTASVTALWTIAWRSEAVPPRALYRGSCSLSIGLGVVWIMINSTFVPEDHEDFTIGRRALQGAVMMLSTTTQV